MISATVAARIERRIRILEDRLDQPRTIRITHPGNVLPLQANMALRGIDQAPE